MKIALLGKGKTGGEVIKVHTGSITVFDSSNPISCHGLLGHEVAISFLPGAAFVKAIESLIESKLPVICGSTGFEWPYDLPLKLEKLGLVWLWSHNFSLGMSIVRRMLKELREGQKLYHDGALSIHEVHHVQKIDAPSGTALSWRELLGEDVKITYERKADVVGYHSATLNSESEIITVSHQAKNRAIFAKGALWAAQYLLQNPLEPGLHHFDLVVEKFFKRS